MELLPGDMIDEILLLLSFDDLIAFRGINTIYRSLAQKRWARKDAARKIMRFMLESIIILKKRKIFYDGNENEFRFDPVFSCTQPVILDIIQFRETMEILDTYEYHDNHCVGCHKKINLMYYALDGELLPIRNGLLQVISRGPLPVITCVDYYCKKCYYTGILEFYDIHKRLPDQLNDIRVVMTLARFNRNHTYSLSSYPSYVQEALNSLDGGMYNFHRNYLRLLEH